VFVSKSRRIHGTGGFVARAGGSRRGSGLSCATRRPTGRRDRIFRPTGTGSSTARTRAQLAAALADARTGGEPFPLTYGEWTKPARDGRRTGRTLPLFPIVTATRNYACCGYRWQLTSAGGDADTVCAPAGPCTCRCATNRECRLPARAVVTDASGRFYALPTPGCIMRNRP